MKAYSKQILLVTISLALVLGLFLMGYKTPYKNVTAKKSQTTKNTFDALAYIDAQTKNLSVTDKAEIEKLTAESENKESLLLLANRWDSLKNSYAAAYYTYKLAQLENNEITWFAAGSKFYNVANFATDSLMMANAINQAKEAYSKVVELNPKNLQAKNALAVCIIQADEDIMKGVGMLKDVLAVDSNNVQAIFTLGMLSIQSNQFDKAQERFEKLIKIEPFNAEYYFYLAEVYAKSGDTQKAIKTYETCKTLINDKEAKKEIESIINKLNKL
ncbi:MAG: tetratricopeptide repeat protein [Bacteroidia bacterium]|nr:tetratricopeptide repeat protein [Bacteroidia bacterium]